MIEVFIAPLQSMSIYLTTHRLNTELPVPSIILTHIVQCMEAVGQPDTQIVWQVQDLDELSVKWAQLCSGRTLENELKAYKSKRAQLVDRYGIRIGADLELYMHWENNKTITMNIYNEKAITRELYEWISGQPFEAIQEALKQAMPKAPQGRRRKILT